MNKKKRFKINKLVRDRIPKILELSKVLASVRRLHESEYLQCLKDKLLEETCEVNQAIDPAELKEELADILEVILAIGAVFDISFEEIERLRIQKAAEKGGFADHIYCSYIEMDASNPGINHYLSQPEKYPEWGESSDPPNV